jgi:hypothetical protein
MRLLRRDVYLFSSDFHVVGATGADVNAPKLVPEKDLRWLGFRTRSCCGPIREADLVLRLCLVKSNRTLDSYL